MELSLRLPVRPESVTAARHSMSGLRPWLGSELLEQLQLLVSELVTNCIRHAGLNAQDWIRVAVAVSGRTARLEVVDPGISFTPPDRPRPEETSGYGLYLVEQMATRWGVQNDDNDDTRVWAELTTEEGRAPGAGG